MATPQPVVGEWYRIGSGETFEVVACDHDDGSIEIQYFDGTVEEMDIEDWDAQADEGTLVESDPPDDRYGSVDVELEDEPRSTDHHYDERRGGHWASPLDGLDIFD